MKVFRKTSQSASTSTEREALSTDEIQIDGEFWSPASSNGWSAPGTITCRSWELPVLNLEAAIVEPKSVSVRESEGVTVFSEPDPDDVVHDFQPITILGRTADGKDLTLFGAQAHGPQMYRAKHLLVGGHFPGEDTLFADVRYQLDNDVLWSNINLPSSASSDIGTLSRENDAGQPWFVFRPQTTMSLRDLGRRALVSSRTLARLALQPELTLGPAQVRLENGTDWLPWHTLATATRRITTRYIGDWLVDPRAISLQQIVDWLDISAKLDGLDTAVADAKLQDNLALQALVFGTIAEGLHRRLYDDELRFVSLTRGQAKAARRAGREAISEAVNDAGLTTRPEDFNDLLSPLNDITFVQRLSAIMAVISEAVPEVLQDFEDWATLVKDVRNYLAHWLTEEDKRPPTTNEMLLVYLSLPWALRTFLLRKVARLDVALMREGYRKKNEFLMYRANVRATIAAG
ncbi:HEPN domain-containing protein [Mycobacterium sp. 852002-51057_SCH5723018]|uniref:HEPN domain-containing protein n=1 Tax=Mycobacterium sp. 852002-51057_SCH5723018 TaxID=1834094 RepID=UPI00350ED5DF